jgi:hypothetical protein
VAKWRGAGGGGDDRLPLAYRDHTRAGPARVPAGVASHELSHAATKVGVGRSGQLERVIAAAARSVREAACAAGPGYLPIR